MHPTLALQKGLLTRSSYYNPDYRTGAALLRARRPYLVRNALTGVVIFGFAIGVFAFTLRAVGQETFDDVIVPSDTDELAASNSTSQRAALDLQIQNQAQSVKAKIPTSEVNGMRS